MITHYADAGAAHSRSSSRYVEQVDQQWLEKIRRYWWGSGLRSRVVRALSVLDENLIQGLNDRENAPPLGEPRYAITMSASTVNWSEAEALRVAAELEQSLNACSSGEERVNVIARLVLALWCWDGVGLGGSGGEARGGGGMFTLRQNVEPTLISHPSVPSPVHQGPRGDQSQNHGLSPGFRPSCQRAWRQRELPSSSVSQASYASVPATRWVMPRSLPTRRCDLYASATPASS